MSVKQDRTAARTAADIERKYNFGKKFSEMLGLIDESRDKVDSVRSELSDKIEKTATELKRDTESIAMSAAREIVELDTRVLWEQLELKMDASQVVIEIEKRVNDTTGSVDEVTTKTGYVFNADGLSISKSGEEMTNKLDNTGMYVQRSGENILAANNNGVEALNLHAKTFLIIGSGDGRSRLEDYGVDRTGVFWVG